MPLRAMNDLAAHNASLAGELTAAVTRVVGSGWYVLGAEVTAFEAAFAGFCGVPHAIGVANGTDALELALASVGVGRDDAVALVANAGGYGTTAVNALGATARYVDVDADTMLIDPVSLDRVLSAGNVRAVVVTHLYGRLAAMPALLAVAAAHGVRVVEDCAQAHGAADEDGRRAGAFGDVAAFSFYPTKNLGALGDAGAVVTADAEVAQRVTRLRQYGWDRKYRQVLAPARNSRLDEIQAAVLSVKLPHVPGWNARRVEIAARYAAAIVHPKVTLPAVAAPGHVAHLYVVRTADRDGLAAHLRAQGVPCEVHYPLPDHRQPAAGDRHAGVSLPVTEQLCGEVLSLPNYPEMRDADVDAVVAAVNRWGA